MTASVSPIGYEAAIWRMAPSLRRLPARSGGKPRLTPKWPCLQLEQGAGGVMVDALHQAAMGLPWVRVCAAPLDALGCGYALAPDVARGQPEAFIAGACWLHLRLEGSLHLSLRPEWAQKVVNKGWAGVHPFARYMAGAIPPQSLVVFAPRNHAELRIAIQILVAAHGYAVGRIGDCTLPDTRW